MDNSVKAAIYEGLGYSSVLRAKELLITALHNEDEGIVCAAIRGLGAIGDKDAVFMIVDMMNSDAVSEIVAGEAAGALGQIDSPDAYIALVDAYQSIETSDEGIGEDIVSALGYRDISETGDFFKQIKLYMT
jgi:HEAT repeat protein